jgi:hypothetical protein
MSARRFRRQRHQRGQVVVLFALAMIVLLGMVAIALDGSYGFVQNRRAQNAADFAAFAAAQKLQGTQACNGGATSPQNLDIYNVVQDVVNANATAVAAGWTGQYLDNRGAAIGVNGTFTPASHSGYPPSGACGVIVRTTPQWNTFLAGVIGQGQLTGYAGAQVGSLAGAPVSIAALNKRAPHVILGGGTGRFLVGGSIYLNSTNSDQPWTSNENGLRYNDVIDAKEGSNLYVYGTIFSVGASLGSGTQWPLDWCFGAVDPVLNAVGSPVPVYPGPPNPTNHPAGTGQCPGSPDVRYNQIDNTKSAIGDPLQASGAPPNPTKTATDINCAGHVGGRLVDPAIPGAGGTMKPGEYTTPVHITTSMTLGDCGAVTGGRAGDPGIYRFDQGLWIDPKLNTDVVTGSNVVIGAGGDAPSRGGSGSKPYPARGNVPGLTTGGVFTASGTGNGAPCLRLGTKQFGGAAENDATNQCDTGASPALYGSFVSKIVPGGSTYYGTGTNFSIMIGGVSGSTTTLQGPTSGPYGGGGGTPGVVLYQDSNSPANFGFDAQPGDAATVSITGVVYDASLANFGVSTNFDVWDGAGGIPSYAGGVLQTGFGAGWSAGGNVVSGGSVTITGTSVVDDFNTDGLTTIGIDGRPYNLPGGGSLSLLG